MLNEQMVCLLFSDNMKNGRAPLGNQWGQLFQIGMKKFDLMAKKILLFVNCSGLIKSYNLERTKLVLSFLVFKAMRILVLKFSRTKPIHNNNFHLTANSSIVSNKVISDNACVLPSRTVMIFSFSKSWAIKIIFPLVKEYSSQDIIFCRCEKSCSKWKLMWF